MIEGLTSEGTMSMSMTTQEMFDVAVAGLASQGFERSGQETGSGFTCKYSDDKGRHCAYYYVDPRTDLVEGQICENQEGFDEKPYHFRAFSRALQDAHDEGETPDMMRSKLRSLAADYSLTLPKALQ